MKIAPRVVAVVISTLSATFPFAIYVHKLLACPPLMLPTNTMPASIPGSSRKANPRMRDRIGIIK